MKKMKEWIGLLAGLLGCIGIMLAGYSITPETTQGLPIAGQYAVSFGKIWLRLLVPLVVAVILKDNGYRYGFRRAYLGRQIIAGLVLGFCLTGLGVIEPHLLEAGEAADAGNRGLQSWTGVITAFYYIAVIGVTEEVMFRGFVWTRLKKIGLPDWAVIIATSVLFGLYHLGGGRWSQIVLAVVFGAIMCICRKKIKFVTTLSLIIGHGVYDLIIYYLNHTRLR